MQKKLTVLFAFAIFVLVVGWASTPAQAHCGGKHTGNHPHCPAEIGEYSVAISGAVDGASDDLWRLGAGGKQIGLGNLSGQIIGHLTDLSFFTLSSPSGPFTGTRGANCFGNLSVTLSPQAFIKQGRGGRAEGWFWFEGQTDNSATTVLYSLKVLGLFENPWPPVADGPTSMVMRDWEIIVEGEGKNIKNISCIGEGGFGDFESPNDNFLPDTMDILVTLVP